MTPFLASEMVALNAQRLVLRHFSALFSALVAGRCAFLAMILFVFGAFIAAGLANLSADPAYLRGKR